MAGYDDERRRWAEQEEADEAHAEYQRSLAVEEMVEWFHYHFEDPQNETPRDEGDFIYIWGGPFDGSEILFDQFIGEHDEDLIKAAVDEIEESGISEWAPTSQGDFYEHPSPDDGASSSSEGATRESLMAAISGLRKQLDDLQTAPREIGHNQPPEEIGSPPYADEDKGEIARLLAVTEEEILLDDPDVDNIQQATSKLSEFSQRAINYVGSKIDLALDESIKKGMPITFAYLAFGEHLQRFIESVRTFFGI